MWTLVIAKFLRARDGDPLVHSPIFYSVGKVCLAGASAAHSEAWRVQGFGYSSYRLGSVFRRSEGSSTDDNRAGERFLLKLEVLPCRESWRRRGTTFPNRAPAAAILQAASLGEDESCEKAGEVLELWTRDCEEGRHSTLGRRSLLREWWFHVWNDPRVVAEEQQQ